MIAGFQRVCYLGRTVQSSVFPKSLLDENPCFAEP